MTWQDVMSHTTTHLELRRLLSPSPAVSYHLDNVLHRVKQELMTPLM